VALGVCKWHQVVGVPSGMKGPNWPWGVAGGFEGSQVVLGVEGDPKVYQVASRHCVWPLEVQDCTQMVPSGLGGVAGRRGGLQVASGFAGGLGVL
jgi:hypothetical protein